MEIGVCPIAHPLVTGVGVTGRTWPGAASVEVAAASGSGERAVIVTGAAPGPETRAVPEIAAETVLRGRTAVRGRGYLRQRAAGRDWRDPAHRVCAVSRRAAVIPPAPCLR